MTKTKEQLPPRQVRVREASNVRRILMAQPVCPVVDDPNDPAYTGETNCQREFGGAPGWWTRCEERGHDPYYTIQRVTKTEDVVDEDGMVTGQRKRVVETRRLNLASVAYSTRINSGRGPAVAREFKGFRTLEEMGYAPVCEFRNCELPVKIRTRYGNYCSDRHARLVGAGVEGMLLEANPNRRGE